MWKIIAMQAEDNNSITDYDIVYRTIRYPRLEFKTGKLLIVLPQDHKNPDIIVEKHKDWIYTQKSRISTALKNAENKNLVLNRNLEDFKNLVHSLVEKFSNELDLNMNHIFFRKMKSKWGSCSSKRNLTINIHLKYLPKRLIEYVIFHEMIHLIERKHNEQFWRIISRKFEDYEALEKDLFDYWFLIQKNGI